MHRPDFLNAFKAFSQLKNLFIKSDPYYRYFTKNIFELAYNDLDQLSESVFFGLSQATKNAIFNDPYGYAFNNSVTLYQWVRAFSEGQDSEIYQDIFYHFNVFLGLQDFTPDTMNQIVGNYSLMWQLNNTFSYNIGHEMKYT
jgi:hypothetical protein